MTLEDPRREEEKRTGEVRQHNVDRRRCVGMSWTKYARARMKFEKRWADS
jgi:hypothetical protein